MSQWLSTPYFYLYSYPLLLSQFYVELPATQVNPKSKQVRCTMENNAFRSFLYPLAHFPKPSFKCSLPKTNKQAKHLPKTWYFDLQDILDKLKQWHFPMILYKICKHRIRRNKLKPQKSGGVKGSTSCPWLLNMGSGCRERLRNSSQLCFL